MTDEQREKLKQLLTMEDPKLKESQAIEGSVFDTPEDSIRRNMTPENMVTSMGMGTIGKPAQAAAKGAFERLKGIMGKKPDRMMELAEAADKAAPIPRWENPSPFGVGGATTEEILDLQRQNQLKELKDHLMNKKKDKIAAMPAENIIEQGRSGGEETFVPAAATKMSLPSVDLEELRALLGKNVKRD